MQKPVLKSIDPLTHGQHCSFYSLLYENQNGHEKRWEMISRDHNLTSESLKLNNPPSSVMMIVLSAGSEPDGMLLSHEFRMPLGKTVISLPSGLIEPGESIEAACKRELKEETGLNLSRVLNILPPAALLPGITNDKTCLVICTALGRTRPRDTDSEHIESFWYNWGAIRNVLQGRDPLKGKDPYLPCTVQAQMAMLYGLAAFDTLS